MNDWKMELAKEIQIESLPDEFQALVEIIGREATMLVMAHFAGMSVYFPYERLLMPIRNKHIQDEFTGFNHKELARKYEVSTTYIRNILTGMREDFKKQSKKG